MIKPIKTEEDNERALRRVRELWDYPEGTPEYDEMDVLATLIEAFEKKHYPMPSPGPVAMVEHALERLNMNRQDLAKVLGVRLKYVNALLSHEQRFTARVVNILVDKMGVHRKVFNQDLAAQQALKPQTKKATEKTPTRKKRRATA